jgi:hypothetical protein
MRGLCCGIGCLLATASAVLGQGAGEREHSLAAFQQIARVMRSPRCMNCHTASDFPRQGDNRRRHDQSVQRGPDDHGVAPMQCSSCHRDDNSPGGGQVPGASEWHLAPRAMSWEQARSDKALCEGLLDKSRNGNREAKGMVIHMTNDPLVQWAWAPGAGRTPPPIAQDDFHALLQRWEATGAACPPSD